MKNLFQREAIDEVIGRIDTLQPATQRQWGKMDVAQMMAHCSATLDMASGRLNTPRAFVGRPIGPFFKSVYTNEKPFSRSSPTDPKLVVSDQRDFLREQEQLKVKLRQFHEGGEAQCTRHPHPFFGALPPQDWARGMYKHLDHHCGNSAPKTLPTPRYEKVGSFTRSFLGTDSKCPPALRHAVKPPTITNVLKPLSCNRCATRALVASRAQVQ